MNRIKQGALGGLFVAPAFSIFLVFMIVPIVLSFQYSFYQWNGVESKVFIGFSQFKQLATDDILITAIKNSLVLTFWAVLIQIPLGMVLALTLSGKLRCKALFQTVFFLPVILSTAVLGILWTQIYDPNIGLINQFLTLIGLGQYTQVWLGDPDLAFGAVIAVVGWQYIGFYMVIYYSALQNIPQELIEAATIDGAQGWYILSKIKIPLIWHVISFTMVFALVNSLKYFDLIYIMTDGGPNHASEVMASYMMKQAFRFFDFGYASTIAVVLFVLGTSLAFLCNTIMKKESIQY